MNVHPQKLEVQFLHETEIIESIVTTIEARIRSHGESRTFSAKTLNLTQMWGLQEIRVPAAEDAGTSTSSSITNPASKKIAEYRLVRTDSQQKKLDQFIIPASPDAIASGLGAGPDLAALAPQMGPDLAASAPQTAPDAIALASQTCTGEVDDQLLASLDVDKIVAEATAQGIGNSSTGSASAVTNESTDRMLFFF